MEGGIAKGRGYYQAVLIYALISVYWQALPSFLFFILGLSGAQRALVAVSAGAHHADAQ